MTRSRSACRLASGLALALVLGWMGSSSLSAQSSAAPATGPLRVLSSNPRYFTDGSGKAIYLAGSQAGGWELQDDAFGGYAAPGTRVTSNFTRYLDILNANNMNYLRLWCVETTRFDKGPPEMVATPMAYRRTGPGNALDGRPRFDLNQFDDAYFNRLRSNCIAARDRGVYVAIMLFEGFSCVHGVGSQYFNPGANPWFGHPFNTANNINGINADANGDGWGLEFHTLAVPAVTALQRAYVRKVVDTVNDLDNVLYEIANESIPESKDWQYDMINTLKSHEATKPKRHPVLISAWWPSGSNTALRQSAADAIAPSGVEGADYENNPPAADGSKVVILDFDHNGWDRITLNKVWKNFLRGNNPVLFDWDLQPFDWNIGKVATSGRPGSAVLRAVGNTRTYADKMNLAAMTPQNSLASTGYCLASAGKEYLVYQPGSGAFTVNLTAGSYDYEWFNPRTHAVAGTGTVTASGGNRSFTPPFSGDAVLYLKAVTTTPPLPTVTISATDPNAGEPSNTGTFTISRTGATTAALTVNFAVSGTATSGTDYTSLGTSVVIPAGSASATKTVSPIDDTVVESSETVILTISVSAAYTVGTPSSATVTIADNDSTTTLPTVTIAATDANAAEPSNTGTFTISRSGATTASLAVSLTRSGTATSGTDFTALPATVTIAAGQASATLTVTPIDDTAVEGNETVILTVAANAAYTTGAPSSATVTIADDDGAGTLPAPWQDHDVGAVGAPGSASYAGGTFTVEASGADIWNRADEFHFVNQPLSGDGSVIARVESLQNTDPWAKAVVMIRETLDADSRHAMTILTPVNGAWLQWRAQTGGTSASTAGPAVAPPEWIRIVRSGQDFTGWVSPDGVNWMAVGVTTVGMATDAYVGLGVTSHNDGVLTTAAFSGVMVVREADGDGDGLSDAGETAAGFDPANPDQDGNGIPDGLDDADGDGQNNNAEEAAGTLGPPGSGTPPGGSGGGGGGCGATGMEALLALGFLAFRRHKRMGST